MNQHGHDVIFFGSGPGGSSAATFLAPAGKPVLVLDKTIFQRWMASSPVRQERLLNTQRPGPRQRTNDFRGCHRRWVGQRVLRMGAAAGCMDRIFSAGVSPAASVEKD